MLNRFFKLIYLFALVALALSFPIYLLTEIDTDAIVVDTYLVKCKANNEYLAVQGGNPDEPASYDEMYIRSEYGRDKRRDFNFHCKYYDEVNKHIVAYYEAEQAGRNTVPLNQAYFAFEESKIQGIYSYPEEFELETISSEKRYYEVYNPIIAWMFMATFVFIILQTIRMSYVYIVFGEIVWHPFRQSKKPKKEQKN